MATAIAYGKLLEGVILTGELNPDDWYKNLPENHVKEEMKVVFEKKDCDHIETAKGFGIACCKCLSSHPAHNVRTTLYGRCYDVRTLK